METDTTKNESALEMAGMVTGGIGRIPAKVFCAGMR